MVVSTYLNIWTGEMKGGSAVLLAENEILSNLMKIGKDKQCLIDNKIRYETMIF
jgi:hypothetical protein